MALTDAASPAGERHQDRAAAVDDHAAVAGPPAAWVPVEAGIYRLNRVMHPEDVEVACPPSDESELPQTFVGLREHPREYFLNSVATIVDVHTRVSDLYRSPYDQIKEQLRLTIETVKERQEGELINNPRLRPARHVGRGAAHPHPHGPPTPDDLDQLITKVWKEPAFFLTHPQAIAAFGRECTRRGVPPPTVSLFGSQFLTWRGAAARSRRTRCRGRAARPRSCCCGWARSARASSGCSSPGLAGEQSPGLSVRFMGINRKAIASYLISLYCSLAVLTDDALAVLDDVEVDKYHEYAHTYPVTATPMGTRSSGPTRSCWPGLPGWPATCSGGLTTPPSRAWRRSRWPIRT